MNISKKAILSFIVALTSVVSMAQPYYHIMKEKNGKLTELKVYDGKDYKIKIDMVKPENRPVGTIGGKITVESDCNISSKRSFYFTKKGNVYYNSFTEKFGFEESQLDCPDYWYNLYHCGHFYWAHEIEDCIALRIRKAYMDNPTETSFYFANPDNLGKLQEDLGNERWAVLSYCEWDYVCKNLGESRWTVDGKNCFLIATTPGKSLLTELRNKNNGNTRNLSIDEFKSLEAQGLVCLPACGYRTSREFYNEETDGYYWSCTARGVMYSGWPAYFYFTPGYGSTHADPPGSSAFAVRLVVLADD